MLSCFLLEGVTVFQPPVPFQIRAPTEKSVSQLRADNGTSLFCPGLATRDCPCLARVVKKVLSRKMLFLEKKKWDERAMG